MHETELLMLGLCAAIPTLSVIARLPGVPEVELDPELVLVFARMRGDERVTSSDVMRRVARDLDLDLDLEEERQEI